MKNKQNININKSSDVKVGNINFNAADANADSPENKENITPESSSSKKKVLKEKIAKNKITEVVKNILDESNLSEEENNFLYAIYYRINTLKDRIGKGISSHEESSIERNKIASSLIGFIDQLDLY